MSTACTDLHGHARTCTDSTDSTDVATERLVRLAVRLAAVMPRTRGYRIGADGSISVYPASPRVRLPAAKQEGSPMPPKCDSRSDQESKRAPNANSHPSRSRRGPLPSLSPSDLIVFWCSGTRLF